MWRKVSFPAITTDRIRVLVNNGLNSYSRIAEVEVYAVSSTANVAPTVSLTSPTNNSSVTAPATITLNANAADSDGTISKVEFYNGATLLNTDTTAPYSYSLNATAGSYTLTAKATDNLGASTTSAAVNISVNGAAQTRSNVALQANGGVATASSIWASGYEPGSANNGVRTGAVWGAGGGWHDNTPGVFPDWLQINFNGSKSIDEVNVYSIQDNFSNPIEPTASSTFTLYGLAAFEVQYWNGSTWVTLPNGAISNNSLVWRKVSFLAITTDRIRVLVSSGLSSYSRIAEVEAYSANATSNIAPTVSLSAPANNASVQLPATITLNATAADSDGTIAKVEFYDGATLLNTDTTAPYSYAWVNPSAGSHVITAKATDNQGAVTTSAAINITVTATSATPGIYYIYADHLNTPRVITDTANAVVWKWDSDPFGTNVPVEGTIAGGVKFSYNLRFPGQYFDRETSLHYNYFRDYDPGTGRYVQSDPIGLSGGVNTYGYANQNPISFIDPDGRLAFLLPFIPTILGGSATVTATGVGTAVVGGVAVAAILSTPGDTPRNKEDNICKPGKPDVLPGDLCAQLALAEAKAGAGVPIMGAMADAPRLVAIYGPGPWIKKQHTHICPDGRKLVIHYFSNGSGLNVELKFV